MNLKKFTEDNREIIQLIYGIILIILIPLLIVYNTVFIIKKYNNSIDVTLQRQALVVGRTISTLIAGDLPWEDFVQAKLDLLMENNSEIQELAVLVPVEGNFKVVASSNIDEVGEIKDSYYYRMAWEEIEDGGLATDSLHLAKSSQNTEAEIEDFENDRFWLVAMPMENTSGIKKALLTVKLSSEIVDELTGYNRNLSIYLLIGTVFIVMLFLLAAVRLWDYALLYNKIKEVDKTKDEFISIASHELRAPVTGIKGHTSMMLDGSLGIINDRVKNSAEMIQSATDRLNVLVEDLLNVSRIEQGRMKIDIKPANIDKIIKGAIEELKVQSDIKGITLNYSPFIDDFPLVNIDINRLEQVLVNIISNAIKYTKEGSIDITVEAKKDKFLEIKIKDTGMGMSAKDRARLFEKFYRVQSNKTRGITGTGLGLWISKRLVELMDGSISVDSIENVGTQFTIQFPILKNKK